MLDSGSLTNGAGPPETTGARRLVAEAATSQVIEAAAIRAGMTVFRRGALLKVAQGITSTEEILRDVPAEQLGLED